MCATSGTFEVDAESPIILAICGMTPCLWVSEVVGASDLPSRSAYMIMVFVWVTSL